MLMIEWSSVCSNCAFPRAARRRHSKAPRWFGRDKRECRGSRRSERQKVRFANAADACRFSATRELHRAKLSKLLFISIHRGRRETTYIRIKSPVEFGLSATIATNFDCCGQRKQAEIDLAPRYRPRHGGVPEYRINLSRNAARRVPISQTLYSSGADKDPACNGTVSTNINQVHRVYMYTRR